MINVGASLLCGKNTNKKCISQQKNTGFCRLLTILTKTNYHKTIKNFLFLTICNLLTHNDLFIVNKKPQNPER